jgi:hypothetical protein
LVPSRDETWAGVELASLEDAARFVDLLRRWRQSRPHWDFAAELLLQAAETGKRRDVEAATAQMEIERVILASNPPGIYVGENR